FRTESIPLASEWVTFVAAKVTKTAFRRHGGRTNLVFVRPPCDGLEYSLNTAIHGLACGSLRKCRTWKSEGRSGKRSCTRCREAQPNGGASADVRAHGARVRRGRRSVDIGGQSSRHDVGETIASSANSFGYFPPKGN